VRGIQQVGSNLSTFKLADGQLETGGAIHLGDIVNQFRKGPSHSASRARLVSPD
jgi:hypothetical protein